jgi:predicted nucleic acid-binding protein
VFLVDTHVISEARRRVRADPGVSGFFERAARDGDALYLSSITVGELRRGVGRIRRRGDAEQAGRLEAWLDQMLDQYADHVLDVDADVAQVWGRLCAPHPDHPIDKQIAATALIHDLVVVTRNTRDFAGTGARVMNPFADPASDPAPAPAPPSG